MTADAKQSDEVVQGKDPEWLSKYPRKPASSVAAREQKLDAELQDSFPASDPPSHTPPRPADKPKS
ncbi:hypothetical protein [Zavarzinia sp. CC-PAN008]|uniref:hypothetical protein n=1 Tax=Zavarzinia sp. CC-PAN008 TaxID=3243332 RepID=UPI003F7453AB